MSGTAQKSNPNIQHLWPVPVLSRRLGKYQKVNPELARLAEEHRKANPGDNNGVYASRDDWGKDLESEAMDDLKKFIMDCVFEIAVDSNQKYWKQGTALNVDIISLWFQISNNFGFHNMHIHGNCSWSGVYYVQTGFCSKSADDLLDNGMPNGITQFYGPTTEYLASGHQDLGNAYLSRNVHNSYPRDGGIIIFPSYLKHMVYPYNGEQDRIVIAFNAQVNGEKGERDGFGFS